MYNIDCMNEALRYKINRPVIMMPVNSINTEKLHDIFIVKEKELVAWKEAIIKSAIEGDFNKATELIDGKEITLWKYNIDELVADLTLQDPKNGVFYSDELLREINSGKKFFITDILEDNGNFSIKTTDRSYDFYKLTTLYPMAYHMFPNIELSSRYGNCHAWACGMAENLALYPGVVVATGYISTFAPCYKILHSWVELPIGKEDWVFDPSRNLAMLKGDYYNLRGVKRAYRISAQTILEERDLRKSMVDYDEYLGKLYLSNRHLAINYYTQKINEDNKNEE